MTAQEAKIVADFLIGDFEGEMQTTMRVLGAVPNEKLDYTPDGKSKTALALVRHITLEDEWLLNCLADGAVVPPPDDSDACGIATPADAVARYQERVPAALARVKDLPGEKFASIIDFLGMFQLPGLHMLGMTVKHSVHHRGQLSAYLRSMGGKVPGIYGPSGDTM